MCGKVHPVSPLICPAVRPRGPWCCVVFRIWFDQMRFVKR